MTERLFPEDLAAVRDALLAFYRQHKRDLPWRRTRDPYAIWLSEIMLQQTQVDTVMPRYTQFLQRYPTVHSLAAASEEQVCEAWAGLGYYRRARHLHAAAQRIVQDHDGEVPADYQVLQGLPGIGRYTAGAISSIAFARPAPIVDGNVVRVLARLGRLDLNPESGPARRILWAWAEALVQGDDPGDFNQAMMELGATVCTPTSPQCSRCPVQPFCGAAAAGETHVFPRPTPKVARQPLAVAFAWLHEPGGVWLVRRPLDGLWAGLWELPSASGQGAKSALSAAWALRLGSRMAVVTHELTHRRVTAKVYQATSSALLRASAQAQLCPDPLVAPLSALAKKAILATMQSRVDVRGGD